MWTATGPQYEQEKTFVKTFTSFAKIAQSTQPVRFVGIGWRTSVTKLLDNAIIGYCKVHGIAPNGREIKEIRLLPTTSSRVQVESLSVTSIQTPTVAEIESKTTVIKRDEEFNNSAPLTTGHLEFRENQKGVSFDSLFGPYLKNANQITVIDPYIRYFTQIRNLMEFMETVSRCNPENSAVSVYLLTVAEVDPEKAAKQLILLKQVTSSSNDLGIRFTFEFDEPRIIHDRSISTDTGWKILLGRGLDIFQGLFDDPFNLAHKRQELRKVKQFGVTYIRNR